MFQLLGYIVFFSTINLTAVTQLINYILNFKAF